MTRIPDNQLRNLGDFSRGMNNVAAETDLKGSELRDAVNIDIYPQGGLSRRAGYTETAPGEYHSLFSVGTFMLAVKNGALVATLGPAATDAVLRTGMTALPVSYAQVGEETYWSDSLSIRRITALMADAPVWLDTPQTPIVAAVVSGGLSAGTYQVTLTMIDATGVESGAPLAAVVEVAEGGGVQVSGISLAAGAQYARLYMTEPNGEVLYQRIEALSASITLNASMLPGEALETQFLYPLPPGQIIRAWNGHVLVASGDTLYFSEPLRAGLCRADNYYRFSGGITMVQVVGEGEDSAGVYVSDGKRVYFLSGSDPEKWAKHVRFAYPAVMGSGVEVPGSLFSDEQEQPYTGPVAVWLAQNGVYCLGLPGGAVRTIREDSVVLPSYDKAAMMLREVNGMRQIVGSFSGEKANSYAVSDTMTATVRRHGVTLD